MLKSFNIIIIMSVNEHLSESYDYRIWT